MSPAEETLDQENETACVVLKTQESYLEFAEEVMCGRCLPCMRGTEQIVEIFGRLTRGEGQDHDLDLLEALAAGVQETAMCRRGQNAAGALADSLLRRDEYEEHVREKRCPARDCSSLVHYTIIPEKCTMCGLCKGVCPRGAITGEEYLSYLADNKPYAIKAGRCDNCGLCLLVCEVGAIELV
jgi:NADH-quinone oxidoreductase subunit F